MTGGTAIGAARRLHELLTKLTALESHAAEDAPGVPFLTAIKGMTIAGYYSTRIGFEQELARLRASHLVPQRGQRISTSSRHPED